VAGLAALLLSATAKGGRWPRAVDLKRSLTATARRLSGATTLDEGYGVPSVSAAYRWLLAAHQPGIYQVRALPEGGGDDPGVPGAYRRDGLASPADTVQRFQISTLGGQAAARLLLSSDADWLKAPPRLELGGQPVEVSLTYDAAKLARPGVYVGNVWARSATDTLAGPVLRLTNTVVVPRTLEQAFATSGALAPGGVDRFLFQVPAGAGGLRVSARTKSGGLAILYLFEPSGQPARPVGSVEAVRSDSGGILAVPGEDLKPGVYEAAVVAPPGEGVSYRLDAEVPSVAVQAIGTGPSAVLLNRTTDTTRVSVTATVTGAVREQDIEGRGGPASLQIALPAWASRMVVDVSLPESLWNQVTDVGALIRDGAGRVLSDQPLEYASGRRLVALDSVSRSGPMVLGLRPAFARSTGEAAWKARVRLVFLREEGVALEVLGMGRVASVTLPPKASIGLQFSPVPPDVEVPPGYAPLVDVVATPRHGPAATRRGAASRAGRTP
jgi:hypothetical protein